MSNQASTTSNVEVMAAGRHSQLQRPISAAPVVISPAASRASSPAHAVDQCAALMVDGSEQARMRTHGIMARPAISTPRPSQLLAGRGGGFRAVTGRRGGSGAWPDGRLAGVCIRSAGLTAALFASRASGTVSMRPRFVSGMIPGSLGWWPRPG